MSKSLLDIKKEISAGVKTSEKGKKKKIHSKGDFNKIATALINTPDYEVKVASTKGDKLVETVQKPVEDFRKYIGKILKKHGVDSQEVQKFVSETQLDNAEWAYPLASCMITEYLDADKKFTFIPTKDFSGSISIEDVPEETKTYKSMLDPKKSNTVKTGAHKKLKAQSKAPKWLKEKVK